MGKDLSTYLEDILEEGEEEVFDLKLKDKNVHPHKKHHKKQMAGDAGIQDEEIL